MEVVIKNNGSEEQKCILFGYNDRCCKDEYEKYTRKKDVFLSLETGSDISVSIDGDYTDSKRLNFINSLVENPYTYSCIEYSQNDDYMNTYIHEYYSDSNGCVYLIPIIIQSHCSAIQENIYPVKIIRDSFTKIKWTTSFLFLLKPNQEIKLKFIK